MKTGSLLALTALLLVGSTGCIVDWAAVPSSDAKPTAASSSSTTDTTAATTNEPPARVVPPTPTDGIKNGDESDVDCGGASAPKCIAGKTCNAHADCASGACPAGACSESPSCKQKMGGATCGAGEVGDATAKHEDCCVSAVVPRADADGGPFKMD